MRIIIFIVFIIFSCAPAKDNTIQVKEKTIVYPDPTFNNLLIIP
jgi:hypothetical protein